MFRLVAYERARETRNTAPKTLPLATAPVVEKVKPFGKGIEAEIAKETVPRADVPAATRIEAPRPVIPLPKSKPRQKPGNQLLTGQTENVMAKGLFRTAASVVIQPTAEEEDRERDEAVDVPRVSKDCGADPRGNKASAPEDDVDMGV
jgi:hypothetical protein